jgi:O-antigen ligase/tetratricopeptide (TPR) repeat protein
LEPILALADAGVRPLALDARGALAAWAWGGTVVLVGAGAYSVGRSRRGAKALATLIGAVATAVALLGLVQQSGGADSIYWASGVGEGLDPAFFGTFVNPNHAGIFLAAAFPVVVAAAATSRWRIALTLWLAGGVLAIAAIATGSRGAWALMLVGVLHLGLLSGSRVLAGLSACLTAGGAVLVAALGPARVLQWSTTWLDPWYLGDDPSMGRISVWNDASRLLADAPWFGVGMGSFHDAFKPVRSAPGFSSFGHAHQEYLQAAVEYGIPAAVLCVVVLGILYASALRGCLKLPRRRRRWLATGYTSAFAVVAVAAMFDFPLRVGAIALLFATVAGSALALVDADKPCAPQQWGQVASGTAGALMVASVFAWVVLLVSLPSTTGVWGDAGRALEAGRVHAGSGEPTRALAEYQTALYRRPLEANALIGLAEVSYHQGRTSDALAILHLASEAHPNLPWPWLSVARIHRRNGEIDQARHAYRIFLEFDAALYSEGAGDGTLYIREALSLASRPARAGEEVLPERADVRCRAAHLLHARGEAGVAEALYLESVDAWSRCAVYWALDLTRDRRAARALEVLDLATPGCGRSRAEGIALVQLQRYADALVSLDAAMRACRENDATLRTALGRARLGLGDPAGVPILERTVEDHPDATYPRRVLIRHYVDRRTPSLAIPHLEHLFVSGAATRSEIDLLARIGAESTFDASDPLKRGP